LTVVPCSALNPWRGTRELPVTNWSRRALRSSSNSSTARQNHLTMFVSRVQCFKRVFFFQSSTSILPRPPIISCNNTSIFIPLVTNSDRIFLVGGWCLIAQQSANCTFNQDFRIPIQASGTMILFHLHPYECTNHTLSVGR